MAHYSHSTSSRPSVGRSHPAAPPLTPLTSIGIVFHDYGVRRRRPVPLWSLFFTSTRNLQIADDAFVYTVSDPSEHSPPALSFRGGTVPDPAMIEQFVGVLHIADVPLTPQQLIAALRPMEHWGSPMDSSTYVILTLMEWERLSIVPRLPWRPQNAIHLGISGFIAQLRAMWGHGRTEYPVISVSHTPPYGYVC
ncbi:hypothetical protein BV25DRAFT_1823806 [Artomyces pyxidatus]|uniref:Uncharacterized protein n=1 Tax=Artomyces pyxidatus TaxID=48021 RepID=A0ACB8T5R5_9AGAM|nr:hypothetical protein BV25DRAFT_1823806 [Artomyces pyxidatus]